jgi:hypothetical protein
MMAKLGFNAEVVTTKGALNAKLELYIFKEGNLFVVYCPSLDLSAYGRSEEEAKDEFGHVFRLHITYCINQQSLEQDLIKYGWRISGTKQKRIVAPSIQQMLITNDMLKDIIFNKNYQKVSQPVQIPVA